MYEPKLKLSYNAYNNGSHTSTTVRDQVSYHRTKKDKK